MSEKHIKDPLTLVRPFRGVGTAGEARDSSQGEQTDFDNLSAHCGVQRQPYLLFAERVKLKAGRLNWFPPPYSATNTPNIPKYTQLLVLYCYKSYKVL